MAALLGQKYQIMPFRHAPTPITGGEIIVDIFAEDVREVLRAQPGFAESKDIDAYVILYPSRYGVTSGREFGTGMGLTERPMFGENEYVLHALYSVTVLDGRDLRELASEMAWNHVPFADPFKGNPARAVTAAYWPGSLAALTEAQRATVAADLKALIDVTLPGTLTRAGLLP